MLSSSYRRLALFLGAVAFLLLPEAPVQATAPSWLVVIPLSENRLYLYQSGQLVGAFPVSVGETQTPTPTARWVIREKLTNPGAPFGTRWMRLYRWDRGEYRWTEYGIHGTQEVEKLGSPASNGCVRLRNPDVEDVFAKVPQGTLVITLP